MNFRYVLLSGFSYEQDVTVMKLCNDLWGDFQKFHFNIPLSWDSADGGGSTQICFYCHETAVV